jgi:hypothetical protein
MQRHDKHVLQQQLNYNKTGTVGNGVSYAVHAKGDIMRTSADWESVENRSVKRRLCG